MAILDPPFSILDLTNARLGAEIFLSKCWTRRQLVIRQAKVLMYRGS